MFFFYHGCCKRDETIRISVRLWCHNETVTVVAETGCAVPTQTCETSRSRQGFWGGAAQALKGSRVNRGAAAIDDVRKITRFWTLKHVKIFWNNPRLKHDHKNEHNMGPLRMSNWTTKFMRKKHIRFKKKKMIYNFNLNARNLKYCSCRNWLRYMWCNFALTLHSTCCVFSILIFCYDIEYWI